MPVAWYNLPTDFPADGATVWVRRFINSVPFQATYTAATDTFATSDGHVLPWYMITRWRAL
jgi:hypothetical protein